MKHLASGVLTGWAGAAGLVGREEDEAVQQQRHLRVWEQRERDRLCEERRRSPKGSKSDATFQGGRHSEPVRQPVPALVDLKAVGVDPPQIAGLKGGEKRGDGSTAGTRGRWGRGADLSDLPVAELLRAERGEGPVQPQQLQAVALQPAAQQEGRQAGRQGEQGTQVSLQAGTGTLKLGRTNLLQG